MPNREHARRLMLILLANDADKQSFRLAQDAPAPIERVGDERETRGTGGTSEALGDEDITTGPGVEWRMWDDFGGRSIAPVL
jgi:hypothetical protein